MYLYRTVSATDLTLPFDPFEKESDSFHIATPHIEDRLQTIKKFAAYQTPKIFNLLSSES